MIVAAATAMPLFASLGLWVPAEFWRDGKRIDFGPAAIVQSAKGSIVSEGFEDRWGWHCSSRQFCTAGFYEVRLG